MTLLFTHATVLPMTAVGDEPKTFIGSVGVVGDRIALVSASDAAVEAFRQTHKDLREIDCRGRLVMPGLINTHCHIAMTLQRSYADDIPLMEWLHNHIWPFEATQTVEDVQLGVELGIAEMLLGGVTSVVDMYFHQDRCVEVARRMGIRALLGCTYFDHNAASVLSSIEPTIRAAEGCDRVRIAVAPHASYTVNEENVRRGVAVCEKYDLPFIVHISETGDEARYMEQNYQCTSVEYFERLGALSPRTIAAHCVHLTDNDIAILARRGVVVSHNPQSNMKISSGVAPIEKMRAAGCRVALGTDGTCSNNDLDLWEELRTAAFLQKSATANPLALPAYEALRLATTNGAQAMGYAPHELGVLCEGALADLIVLDLRKPHLQPIHDVVSNLVYCAKAADVDTVVVGGELVVEDRQLRSTDLTALYGRVATAVQRITEQIDRGTEVVS